MRVVLLSPFPPEQSALADYAGRLKPALNQAGVEVLTPMAGQRPLQSLDDARDWVAARDWRRVDVVHAELAQGRASEFLVLQALASMRQRPALSATAHAPDRLIWRATRASALSRGGRPLPGASMLADPWVVAAERKLARQLDGLVCLSQTGAQALARRMKVPLQDISVIAHGVRSLPVHAPQPLNVSLPDSPEGQLQLLYFGYVRPGKGIEDLLDAWSLLRKDQPELGRRIVVTIAGGSITEHGGIGAQTYVRGLRQRAERAGLQGDLHWELDVDERDIPALMARHHLTVLPYRETRKGALLGRLRSTSGALAWSLACGRGVLASDARSFPEELGLGVGACFKAADARALAERMAAIFSDPSVIQRWSQAAALLAQERAWSLTGQRYAGHFQRCALRRTRSGASRDAGATDHPGGSTQASA